MYNSDVMRSMLCLLLIFTLIGCSRGPVEPRLSKDMANFDRVYIPTLIFTNLLRQRESEISFARLEKKWKKFGKDYYGLELKFGVDIVDKFWKEDFDKITELMASVEVYVKDKNLKQANLQLKRVPFILLDLRHRNGLKYALDPIYNFSRTVDKILGLLAKRSIIRDRDLDTLRSMSIEALEKWSIVAETDINTDVFGFDKAKVKAIKKRFNHVQKTLEDFNQVVLEGSREAIPSVAAKIKPPFVILYKAFGNFDPIFKQMLKERPKS